MTPHEAQLEKLRIRSERAVELARAASAALGQFFKYASILGCFVCFYLAISALAGKATVADINLTGRMLTNKYFADIVFFLFGVGGIGYGHYQRTLFRKTTHKLKRFEKYEKKLDPNRSTSGLLEGYESNPEDVL